jgi:hypothetical protein
MSASAGFAASRYDKSHWKQTRSEKRRFLLLPLAVLFPKKSVARAFWPEDSRDSGNPPLDGPRSSSKKEKNPWHA